jgi:CheY-like chemotaxis protein
VAVHLEVARHIVVVEHDYPLRSGLVRLLQAYGYSTIAAESAEAAVDAVQACEGAIVAIICEVPVSGLAGLEFIRWVRVRLPLEPMLLITTCDNEELDRLITASDSATSVLRKPFRLRHIREWLVRYVLATEGSRPVPDA